MKPPTRGVFWTNAGCLAVLAWLYGGDLRDAFRAAAAEVSALTEPPHAAFAAGVLVLALAAVGAFGFGVLNDRGPDFKGFRLLPILLVVALFVDLLALSSSRLPLSSADQATLALDRVRALVGEVAKPGRGLPAQEELVRKLPQLGDSPYLIRGERVRGYGLQVRRDCQGPVKEAPGVKVGTFLYCVAPGGRSAWISVVGLPAEARFGEPAVFSRGGQVESVEVAGIPEEAAPTPALDFGGGAPPAEP